MALNFKKWKLASTGEPVAKIQIEFNVDRDALVHAAANLLSLDGIPSRASIEAEIRKLVALYGDAFLLCPSDYVYNGYGEDYSTEADAAVQKYYPELKGQVAA